jgi:CelD/BcsL family acetyltransferase involved in cellulose biosynthesis
MAVEIASHPRIEDLAREWDELADRQRSTPWVRPGWVDAWWRALGAGTLQILALRREGRVAGVLPLYRRAGAVRSTTNSHTPGSASSQTTQRSSRSWRSDCSRSARGVSRWRSSTLRARRWNARERPPRAHTTVSSSRRSSSRRMSASTAAGKRISPTRRKASARPTTPPSKA